MYYSFCILYFRSHKNVLKEIQNNVKVTMSTSTAVDVNMFQMSTSTVAYSITMGKSSNSSIMDYECQTVNC